MRLSHRTATLVVTAFAALALALSLGANAMLRAALNVGFRTPQTQFWYPWTVRADLLLLLALAVALIYLSDKASFSRPRGEVVVTALGLAIAAAVLDPIAGLSVLLAFFAVVYLGPRLASGSREVVLASVVALALRVLVALVLSVYARIYDDPAVFDDEVAYHRAATQLATILANGFGDLDFEWRNLAGHHLDLLGGLYATFGVDFLPFRLFNALLAALAVPVAARLAAAAFGPAALKPTAWLVALWPLLILWGGSGLRDAMVVLLALALPWLTFSSRDWLLRVLSGAMCLLVLSSLRPLVALASVGGLVALGAYAIVRGRVALRASMLAPVALVAAFAVISLASGFGGGGGAASVLAQLTPRGIEYRYAATELTPLLEHDERTLPEAPGGLSLPLGTVVRVELPGAPGLHTAVLYWYDDEPPRYRVKFADGTTRSLLPPAVHLLTDETIGWSDILTRWVDSALLIVGVTSLDTPQRLLSVPDTLVWDGLLLLSLASMFVTPKPVWGRWLSLAAYVALVLLGLSGGSTNLGTVLRHRSTLVPWLAILAFPALLQLTSLARTAVARPLGRPAPPPAPGDPDRPPSTPAHSQARFPQTRPDTPG